MSLRQRGELTRAHDEGRDRDWQERREREPVWEPWDHDPGEWQEEWGADWDTAWRGSWDHYEGVYEGKGESRRSWSGGSKGRGKGGGKNPWADGAGGSAAGVGRLHVANLPRGTTEDSLRSMFQPFGTVLGVKILATRGSGVASSIVRFGSAMAAEAAIASLHGKQDARSGGSPLEVKLARPSPKWDA